MRIRLHLEPEHYPATLPIDYHYLLASLIYDTVATSSPKYASFLHDEGYRVAPGAAVSGKPIQGNLAQNLHGAASSSKRFKLFVFSRLATPRAQLIDNTLRMSSGIIGWQVSSPMDDFVGAFVTGLVAKKRFRIGSGRDSCWLNLKDFQVIMPPRFSNRMRFVALSPLTVAVTQEGPAGELQKHYVRADDERFGSLVVANLIEKHRALTGTAPADTNLKFDFDWNYIERNGGPGRVSKLVNFKGTKIKSYLAPFFLSGNSELIQLGWECGFGAGNSMGFGMAEAAY